MIRRVSLVFLGLVLLAPGPASAGTNDVEVDDNEFRPATIGNRVGDSIRWFSDGTSNPHNVHQDGGLFHSGDPTLLAFQYTVAFSAGTFHYYCQVHGSEFGGMDGLVKIPVRIFAAPAGRPFTVRWATMASETGSLYDVQFRVGSGNWRNWKRDATALSRVFGRNGNPVRVREGVRYTFRARSQEGGAVSRWSPRRSFTP